MRLLSLVFVFLSLACCHAQDQQHMGKYIRFELVGKSGQIRVFPANNTRGDVYTQLKWNKLEEWDPQGNKVQSVNEFASQQVSWGTPYTTTVQGNNATATTLTGSVTVGNNGNGNGNGAGTGVIVPLNITIFLFDRTVTVQNGNSTVDVNINSIKFNVDMTGWPFKSPNNTLAFGVSLDSMGGRSATQDNDQDDVAAGSGSKGGRAQKIQFGPGSLVSPKNALIDGVDTPIIVKYEGNRNLVWQFPSFKTLKYDPTLGTDVTITGNSGTMIQPSLFMFILIAFCTYLVRA